MHGRSRSTPGGHRHASCCEHRLATTVRSAPTAHRKTKRNQTSHRLLAGGNESQPLTAETPLWVRTRADWRRRGTRTSIASSSVFPSRPNSESHLEENQGVTLGPAKPMQSRFVESFLGRFLTMADRPERVCPSIPPSQRSELELNLDAVCSWPRNDDVVGGGGRREADERVGVRQVATPQGELEI